MVAPILNCSLVSAQLAILCGSGTGKRTPTWMEAALHVNARQSLPDTLLYLNTGGYVLPALHNPIPLKRGKFKFFGDGAEENTQFNTARTVCRQQSVGCSFTYEGRTDKGLVFL
jgi:hypothetical protein